MAKKFFSEISIPGWKREATFIVTRGDDPTKEYWTGATWSSCKWDAQGYIIRDGYGADFHARRLNANVEVR